MVKGILFDLEGTLVDTKPAYLLSMNKLLQRHGKEPVEKERFYDLFPRPNEEILSILGFRQEEIEDAQKELFEIGKEIIPKHLVVINSSPDVLKKASEKKKIAVVSNSRELIVRKSLETIGIDFLDALVCRGETKRIKPFPDPLLKACQKMGLKPGECAMIGDSKNDILAGKAAGVSKTVIVPYKERDLSVISSWGADKIAKDLKEGVDWIAKQSSRKRQRS